MTVSPEDVLKIARLDRVARAGVAQSVGDLLALGVVAVAGLLMAALLVLHVQRAINHSVPTEFPDGYSSSVRDVRAR